MKTGNEEYKIISVTLGIFTSFETQTRIEAFRESCEIWRCHAVTNARINTTVGLVQQHVVEASCDTSEYTQYVLGNMRYLVGYGIIQKHVFSDWVLLVDDDTRVFPQRSVFLRTLDPIRPVVMGDFARYGRSNFACGGGGFLFSRAAFAIIDFAPCTRSAKCQTGADHALARCLVTYRNITLLGSYGCGTCSNTWSSSYTIGQLTSERCKFMHNQRSHAPKRYKKYVYEHLPLTVHRWANFFAEPTVHASLYNLHTNFHSSIR